MSGADSRQAGDSSVNQVHHATWWITMAVIATAGLIYGQTFSDLWPFWTDTDSLTHTHGPLIAIVMLWLLWRARAPLQQVALRPSIAMLPLALLLSLAWLVVAEASIVALEGLFWPLLAMSVVLVAGGWRVLRWIAFPLAYLWFAVPMWDPVNRLLQAMTIKAVGVLNWVTHVPSQILGNIVVLPQGRFEIAGECSGLHFFMVGLAIGALAGEIHRDRLPTRVLLLVLAGSIALVTNWLRVYLIILAGYLTDMQHFLITVDHYYFGWLVFAVCMAGFFLILGRLPARAEQAIVREDDGPCRPVRAIVAATVAVLLLPLVSHAAKQIASPVSPWTGIPSAGGFSGPLAPGPLWQPEFKGVGAERRNAYLSRSGRVVEFYSNRYVVQRQGEELVGYGNSLFDVRSFVERGRERVLLNVGETVLPAVQVSLETRSGSPWVALYRYYVGERWYQRTFPVQLSAGFRSLWGEVPAGVQATAVACSGDCDAALEDAAALLLTMRETNE